MKRITVSCVALMDSDDRILLSKRADDKYLGGLWEFPGGKLENDETPKEALFREIKEELGIELCIDCISLVDQVNYIYNPEKITSASFETLIYLFICRKWQGIPFGKERQETKWVRAADIENYIMPEANKELLISLKELLNL